jgi:hypothetical protein
MVTKSQPWASGYANEHYNAATTPSSVQYQHPDLQGFPRGEGRPIEGTYVGGGSLHYEAVDRSNAYLEPMKFRMTDASSRFLCA